MENVNQNTVNNYVEFIISSKDERVQLFRKYLKKEQLDALILGDDHLCVWQVKSTQNGGEFIHNPLPV